MVVTVCKIGIFFLDEPDNLKRKRQMLMHIKERIKKRFEASVAEVDFQDKWQRSVLGMSFVSLTEHDAKKVAAKIFDFIERDGSVEIFDKYIDFYVI